MAHLLLDGADMSHSKNAPLLDGDEPRPPASAAPSAPSRFVPPADDACTREVLLRSRAHWMAGTHKPGATNGFDTLMQLELTKDCLTLTCLDLRAGALTDIPPHRVYLANVVGASVSKSKDAFSYLTIWLYRSEAEDNQGGCCSCGSSGEPADKQLGHRRQRIKLVFKFYEASSAYAEASAASGSSQCPALADALPPAPSSDEAVPSPAPSSASSSARYPHLWLASLWASALSHLAQGLIIPWQREAAGSTLTLSWELGSRLPPRRKLLVILNPVSGQGKGVQLYEQHCKPMLEDAHCDVSAVVTTHAGHATELVSSLPAAEAHSLDGIIAVGGDGALSEVIQGLMDRPDWRQITKKARIGALPGGSGNGLVVSFLKSAGLDYGFANAALLIAKNASCPMDIASTFVMNDEESSLAAAAAAKATTSSASEATGKGKDEAVAVTVSSAASSSPSSASNDRSVSLAGNWGPSRAVTFSDGSKSTLPHRRWQFLSTSWAIVSDIDIESESCRCLGAARFDAYGALRALCLRKYKGTLSFLPLSSAERSGQKWHAAAGITGTEGSSSSSTSSEISPAVAISDGSALAAAADKGAEATSPSELIVSAPSIAIDSLPVAAAGAVATAAWPPIRHLVPFDHPVPLSWKSFDSETFTMVYITNTSHQSIGVCAAPGTKHHDGYFTITVVRNCGPTTMIPLLLGFDDHGSFAQGNMHFSEGGPVEVYKALAFRLEPEMNPKISRRGHISLDGEDMPYGPIQAEIHPNLIKVFAV